MYSKPLDIAFIAEETIRFRTTFHLNDRLSHLRRTSIFGI